MSLEDWVEKLALHGALAIEAMAGTIIVFASLRAGYRAVLLSWVRRMGSKGEDPVRLELGETLSLALEFLVGADVLRTAVSPDWTQLGQLGAIVGIRSLLNYFLDRERGALEREIAAERKVG